MRGLRYFDFERTDAPVEICCDSSPAKPGLVLPDSLFALLQEHTVVYPGDDEDNNNYETE